MKSVSCSEALLQSWLSVDTAPPALFEIVRQPTATPARGADPDQRRHRHLMEMATDHNLRRGYDFGDVFAWGLNLILDSLTSSAASAAQTSASDRTQRARRGR
jgi:hypothetical protein